MSVRIELADGGVAPSAIYPWSVSGTVNVGDVVALDASAAKTVLRADADNASARPPIGVCIARSGSLAQVALNGEIASGLSGLTRGTAYWLSTSAGQLVSTKPGSNAYAVGVAVSATELLVDGCLAVLDGSGGGGVNSVGVTSSDSSLTVSNSPITGSGSVGLALNTVGVAKGGTGLTSASEQGAMLYASSSSAYVMQSVSPTFKNRIINGGMTIDQRAAGNVTANDAFIVDRWINSVSSTATAYAAKSAVAPTGFTNSILFNVTTGASTPVPALSYAQIGYKIEGTSVADLAWGTASAKAITISFWVRSSSTGTYCVGLRNSAYNRSYIAEYTISAQNTWEKKTLTIPGDTSGTWLTNTGRGIQLNWDLGTGSTYRSTAGSWLAGEYFTTANQVSLITQSNSQFYVTGIQLEVGSVATAFELRPEQIELALCQRYFSRLSGALGVGVASGVASSSAVARVYIKYPQAMRSAPVVSAPNARLQQSAALFNGTLGTVYAGTDSLMAEYSSTGMASGVPVVQYMNSINDPISLSAEL